MSVKVLFEIGHEAAIRDKETPNGFTHDWEVFVRGGSGADISHFIDKIVFHLHETFEKPKRVVKEPPYNVKDSGYGSFTLLIEIYLKNRGEPKKIQFNYDLHLQQTGPPIIKTQKEKYVFSNVTEEFKKKLIKGGGIIVPDTVNFDNDRFKDSEEKGQLLGKPKLGGDIHKRHKPKEHRSEDSTKTNSFADLFGTPITKGSKVSPDTKKSSPSPKMTATSSVSLMSSAKKDEKIVKEKIEKPDKGKGKHSPQKERDRDSKPKEDRTREDRRKAHSKERERSRDSIKRPASPKRSPSRPKSSSSGRPEEVKVKQDGHEKKSDSSKDKKAKKEKRSHDKDKDRDKKEHRRDKDKEVVAAVKATPLQKPELKAPLKEKDIVVKEKEKTHDKERSVGKPSDTPNSVKLDTPENKIEPKSETKTNAEKKERDGERRHKHKKKDKKKDESRADKDKEFREKKNKDKDKDKDKVSAVKPAVLKDVPQNNGDNSNSAYTKPTHKEKNPLNKLIGELSDKPSDDSDNSNKSEDVKLESKDVPAPERPVNENSNSQEKTAEKVKEKTKKNKSKSADKEERKRKRRSKEELPENTKVMSEPEPPPKVPRREPSPEPAPSEESPVENRSPEHVEESPDDSSQHIPPDYMSELKDLQHKIMTMQDNEELQQVVQMIAETGQYEVTPKTFDFDLCTLDRSTVQRLQEFFATS